MKSINVTLYHLSGQYWNNHWFNTLDEAIKFARIFQYRYGVVINSSYFAESMYQEI